MSEDPKPDPGWADEQLAPVRRRQSAEHYALENCLDGGYLIGPPDDPRVREWLVEEGEDVATIDAALAKMRELDDEHGRRDGPTVVDEIERRRESD